jgi:hypothetical protein
MSAEILGPEDLPSELHFEIYKAAFRSGNYDVDLTRKSTRTAPDWVTTLALWQLYWKTVRLYVPGESWYGVDIHNLRIGTTNTRYEQPWRTSLRRMLKFANRLFCYPEQEPFDPNARREEFPHPARLRDIEPPKSIEFEVLCHFDFRSAGKRIPLFRTRAEITNIRALLWLFTVLKCHHPENRHRLDIVLKWKDQRYTRPKALILECHGGAENSYAYREDPKYPTKAAIPDGLGIKERYMQVIEEGLNLLTGYLIEKETRSLLSDAQKAEVPKSKYWAPMPADAPKAFRIGMISARNEVFNRNLVNRLAVNICKNLRTQVFDINDKAQSTYLEFWQRVSLNIAPPLPGDMYHSLLTQEFLQYLDSLVPYSGTAIWEFTADPKAFAVKYNVKPQILHLFKQPIDCEWTLANYTGLGTQALRPWNDDSDSDWS